MSKLVEDLALAVEAVRHAFVERAPDGVVLLGRGLCVESEVPSEESATDGLDPCAVIRQLDEALGVAGVQCPLKRVEGYRHGWNILFLVCQTSNLPNCGASESDASGAEMSGL